MSGGPLVLSGPALELRLERQGDRWRHVVVCLPRPGGSEGAMEPPWLLQSIEGTADEPWPASPPWQEARIEQLADDRQVLLAIGMAGRSHWSLAAQFDETGEHLHFDVACRVHERPEWLGSRYRLSGAQAGGALALAAGPDSRLTRKEQELTIEPTEPSKTWPATVRWRYHVAV